MDDLKKHLDYMSNIILDIMEARKDTFVDSATFDFVRALTATNPHIFQDVQLKTSTLSGGTTHQITFI